MASGSGASVGEQSVSEEILKKWAKWEKETVERIRDRGGSTELFAREYKNPVVTVDHRQALSLTRIL